MAAAPNETRRFHVLVLTASSIDELVDTEFGAFTLQRDTAAIAAGRCDALIIDATAPPDIRAIAIDAAHDLAVIVVTGTGASSTLLEWLQLGAQEVLTPAELRMPNWPARLRAAIERKRLERDARTAYATDLETGLPHQQQFIEHVSQLLALRAREPAPMAVLVLRIEGFATTEARLGREAANVLRRKVGVRLRAGVRASDVVASLADDGFAVLLGSILAPTDASRVGAKLLESLMRPFGISAQDVTVATALGIAHYPTDGTQPEALLRRASGLAAATQAEGRAGFSNAEELGDAMPGAANDD
jgi:diguanylate cyclase (GGDEF)-like protein